MEEADGGTLFLDEIGEMPVDLQAKLLRVLESGEFIKVGETKPTKVNMRVIAATNRDLPAEIAAGNFREDLYYRLSVFQIKLPSLGERPSDIDEYARHFTNVFAAKMDKPVETIEPGYLELLRRHPWRGNIRELRNVVERSMIMASDGVLRAEDLPVELQHGAPASDDSTLPLSLRAIEKQHIARMLGHTGGNKTEAARLLGIGLTTLYRKNRGVRFVGRPVTNAGTGHCSGYRRCAPITVPVSREFLRAKRSCPFYIILSVFQLPRIGYLSVWKRPDPRLAFAKRINPAAMQAIKTPVLADSYPLQPRITEGYEPFFTGLLGFCADATIDEALAARIKTYVQGWLATHPLDAFDRFSDESYLRTYLGRCPRTHWEAIVMSWKAGNRTSIHAHPQFAGYYFADGEFQVEIFEQAGPHRAEARERRARERTGRVSPPSATRAVSTTTFTASPA